MTNNVEGCIAIFSKFRVIFNKIDEHWKRSKMVKNAYYAIKLCKMVYFHVFFRFPVEYLKNSNFLTLCGKSKFLPFWSFLSPAMESFINVWPYKLYIIGKLISLAFQRYQMHSHSYIWSKVIVFLKKSKIGVRWGKNWRKSG